MKRTKVCIGFISIFIITMYLVVALTGCGKDKPEFVGKGLGLGNSVQDVKERFPATREYLNKPSHWEYDDRLFSGTYKDMPFMAYPFREVDCVQFMMLENVSEDYDLNEILGEFLPDDVVEIPMKKAAQIVFSDASISNDASRVNFEWNNTNKEQKNYVYDYYLYSEKFKQCSPSSSGVIYIGINDDEKYEEGKKEITIFGSINREYGKKYQEEREERKKKEQEEKNRKQLTKGNNAR